MPNHYHTKRNTIKTKPLLTFYTFVSKPPIVISTYNATSNISFYCLTLLTCKSCWISSFSCLCGDLQSHQFHTAIYRSLFNQDGRKSECNSISFRWLSIFHVYFKTNRYMETNLVLRNSLMKLLSSSFLFWYWSPKSAFLFTNEKLSSSLSTYLIHVIIW